MKLSLVNWKDTELKDIVDISMTIIFLLLVSFRKALMVYCMVTQSSNDGFNCLRKYNGCWYRTLHSCIEIHGYENKNEGVVKSVTCCRIQNLIPVCCLVLSVCLTVPPSVSSLFSLCASLSLPVCFLVLSVCLTVPPSVPHCPSQCASLSLPVCCLVLPVCLTVPPSVLPCSASVPHCPSQCAFLVLPVYLTVPPSVLPWSLSVPHCPS